MTSEDKPEYIKIALIIQKFLFLKGSKLKYIEIYKNYVKKENEEKIRKLFHETGEWKFLQIDALDIVEEKDRLSYILLKTHFKIDEQNLFAAAMFGIFLDGKEIPHSESEIFYLPTILTTSHGLEISKRFTTIEQSIQHELCHLEDILQWISEEPDYISNAKRYTIDISTIENLKQSIFFECRKIFKLEPRAYHCDFQAGETIVIQSFLLWIIKYKCKTFEEYLIWQLASYFNKLRSAYKIRFPERKENIDQYFREAIDIYGKEVLGENPNDILEKHEKTKVSKLLDPQNISNERSSEI